MKNAASTSEGHDDSAQAGGPLRRRAERRIAEKRQGQHPAAGKGDMEKLVHELQVHQIELEIRNEELVRAQNEAESLLEQYTELYDFAPVGYFTLDSSGIIRQSNLTGAVLLGSDRSLLAGSRFADFITADTRPVFRDMLCKLSEQPETKTREAEFSIKGPRRAVVKARAQTSETGPEYFMAVTDITEQKRSEEALILANRKLNLLSNITRHDILNQILALKGYLELSAMSIKDPEKLREFIAKEQKAMSSIERQIMFTRDYQEMGMTAPVWKNVSACLEEAVAGLPLRDVKIDADTTDLEVFADPLCEKVIYNLIDNALRYGGDRMTTISVRFHGSEDGLVIIFEDNGRGIAHEDKKRLFEPGFGIHTGLGLNLAREILSITGITIAETGEPGKGARFEIVVPEGCYRFTSCIN